MKNNNQSIIHKLSTRSIKSYKHRSLMTIIAIVLTCVLITSVLTISSSLLKSFEYTKAMQVGTLSHGGFKRVEPSDVETLIRHSSIKSYGLSTILGQLDDEMYQRRNVEIRTMDQRHLENSFLLPIEGKMPQAYDEIVVDKGWLDAYELPYDLNQVIQVTMLIGEEHITEELTIVGVAEKNVYLPISYFIVSEAFKDEYVIDSIQENMLGAVDIGINFNSKWHIEDKLIQILIDQNIDIQKYGLGINWAYVSDLRSYQLTDVLSYIFLLFMLMGSGYLIIYNIYLIAVTKDINYYGLLKTIGATSRQIKRLVILQGIKLFLIGLPIGLLLGYGVGLLLVPYVLSILNTDVIQSSGHVSIFIFASLLTFVTVLISCRAPARYASRVSPIEAVRTVEVAYKKKVRRRKSGNKVHKMAWSNLFRVKKKAVLVILSIVLSISILTGVFIQISGFDKNKFLERMIGSDYLIGYANYFSYDYDGENLPQDLLDSIDQAHPFYMQSKILNLSERHKKALLDDIEVPDESSYGESELREGRMTLEMFGADEYILDELRKYVTDGNIPENMKENDIIIEGKYFTSIGFIPVKLQVGDTLNVEGENYHIVAIVNQLPLYLYDQSARQYSLQTYVHGNEGPLMTIMHNGTIDKKAIEKKYPNVIIKSRQDYINQMDRFILTLKVVGFSLSGILGLIGILNFTNMMATSIMIRKREFAILQSIGMTKKQLKKMLMFEGLYVMMIAIIASLGLSLIINVMMTHVMLKFYMPLVIMMALFTCIVMVIPVIVYKTVEKQSIVERIRTVE